MKIIVKTEDGAGIVGVIQGQRLHRELEGAQDNENSTFISVFRKVNVNTHYK